jgi:hypothetical protein
LFSIVLKQFCKGYETNKKSEKGKRKRTKIKIKGRGATCRPSQLNARASHSSPLRPTSTPAIAQPASSSFSYVFPFWRAGPACHPRPQARDCLQHGIETEAKTSDFWLDLAPSSTPSTPINSPWPRTFFPFETLDQNRRRPSGFLAEVLSLPRPLRSGMSSSSPLQASLALPSPSNRVNSLLCTSVTLFPLGRIPGASKGDHRRPGASVPLQPPVAAAQSSKGSLRGCSGDPRRPPHPSSTLPSPEIA